MRPSSLSVSAAAVLVLALLPFSASSAATDTTTPTLTSFTRLSSATVGAGDQIRIGYLASDAGAGIRTVVFSYSDPTGNAHQARAEGDAAPTGPATTTVGSTWPSGSYELRAIYLYDHADNAVIYHRDGSATRNPETAAGPGSHSFNLATADFAVGTGGSTDDGSTDGGSTDGGSTDGGSTDDGTTDDGTTDDGTTDDGTTDDGTTDDGTTDGSTDGGSTDGGTTGGGSTDDGSTEDGTGTSSEGSTFSDTAGSPHEEGIEAVAEAGVAGGYSDGTYRPGIVVNRGQMATFLQRALDLPPAQRSHFSDTSGSVHADAIDAVAEAGIAGGYGDGTFRPNAPVSRAHMATFLQRGFELPPAEGGTQFSDTAGSVHADAIDAVAEAGIAGGYSDGTFRPNIDVNRGQMATFLARALGLI